MAISSLTGTLSLTDVSNALGTATNAQTPVGQTSNAASVALSVGWPSTGGGTGACDEVARGVLNIAANTSTTLNLASLTDVLNQTVTLVRLKKYVFVLLSVAQDPIAGTNCSSVTIGNAAALPHPLDMSANTTTKTLGNGGVTAWASANAAGVAVNTNTGGCAIKVANNDLTNTASVYYSLAGATV